MPLLYDRAARLTVWEPKPDAFFSDPNARNALIMDKLQLTFTIERTAGSEPDTCEIVVTNANDESRAMLHRKPLSARLEAGYDGDLRTLFIGDLIYGASKLEGTEWKTTLQLADGMRAYRNARVTQSFREGVTVLEALRSVAKALQFNLPSNITQDPALQTQFASGLTLQGSAADQLTRLLEPHGFAWSIQNGHLTILKASETTGTALVVDQANGMVGTPETGAPTKDEKIPLTTVQILLNERALPGKLISLTSRQHTGALFKITKASITGDTHGGDFFNTLEVKPV